MSEDGQRFAVGELTYDGAAGADTDVGRTTVWEFSSGVWVQMGSDLVGEADGDNFGEAVALSPDGNWLAVGAPLNSGGAFQSGHVRVFEYAGSSWQQRGGDIDGTISGGYFGQRLSLSDFGDTGGTVRLIVGAPRETHYSRSEHGAAYVYEYNSGSNSWIQLGGALMSVSDAGGRIGEDVAISHDGSRVVYMRRPHTMASFNGALIWGKEYVSGSNDFSNQFLEGGTSALYPSFPSSWGIQDQRISFSINEDASILAISRSRNVVRVFQMNDGSSTFTSATASMIGGEIRSGYNYADQFFGYSLKLSSDGKRIAIGDPASGGYVDAYLYDNGQWDRLGQEISYFNNGPYTECSGGASPPRVRVSGRL